MFAVILSSQRCTHTHTEWSLCGFYPSLQSKATSKKHGIRHDSGSDSGHQMWRPHVSTLRWDPWSPGKQLLYSQEPCVSVTSKQNTATLGFLRHLLKCIWLALIVWRRKNKYPMSTGHTQTWAYLGSGIVSWGVPSIKFACRQVCGLIWACSAPAWGRWVWVV